MPVQRDYILRLLEQATAVLRRLRELLGAGTAEPAAIVEEARAAQAELFGDTWMLLQQVDVATATGLIRDPRQLAVWADLLRVEAEANRELGDAKRAVYLETRAAGLAAGAARGAPTSIVNRRLLVLMVAVGCRVIPEEENAAIGTTAAARDTQTIELAGPPAQRPVIADTLIALDPSDSIRRDTTNPPIARDDELAALAATLTIPVAGVKAEELLDTFNEMRGERRHDALDVPAPRGTPVLSATDGRVLRVFTSERGGLMIYAADASERFVLMYAHLDRYADGMSDGVALQRGQVIGYVGTTGNAPPNVPHLHFAIARSTDVSRWWEGTPVDALPLLRR